LNRTGAIHLTVSDDIQQTFMRPFGIILANVEDEQLARVNSTKVIEVNGEME